MPSKPVNFLGAVALGYGLAYFLDADQGPRRRNTFRDQALSKARKAADSIAGTAQGVGNQAQGVAAKAAQTARDEEPPPNDQALAAKVESEVFRDADVPKGDINVDVSDGIVALRGEVENTEMRTRLDAEVRKIAGVRDVQNLLHLPGEQPPNLSPVAGGTGEGS